MTGAEERMAKLGLIFQEADLGAGAADVSGCLRAEIADGQAGIRVVVSPGLQGESRVSFADWAESRIQRFVQRGPEPDGWQQHDAGWQLCARQTDLPSLD